jgi:hypothetical protein
MPSADHYLRLALRMREAAALITDAQLQVRLRKIIDDVENEAALVATRSGTQRTNVIPLRRGRVTQISPDKPAA